MICVACTISAWMSDRISPIVVGAGAIGRHHDLQRLGVVHEGREGLAELMSNRARQRRHRLAATRVGGKGQVPPALDLGPLPCAALVQEPGNQERLDDERGQHGQDGEPVFPPQAGASIAHDAACRQSSLGDAPPLQLAPVEHRWTCGLCWYADLCRRCAIQEPNGDVGRAATQGVDGHHRPADDARSEEHVCPANMGAFAVARSSAITRSSAYAPPCASELKVR